MLEWIIALGFFQIVSIVYAYRCGRAFLRFARIQTESTELTRKIIDAQAARLKNLSFQSIQIVAAFGEHEKRIAKLEQSRTYDAAGGVN